MKIGWYRISYAEVVDQHNPPTSPTVKSSTYLSSSEDFIQDSVRLKYLLMKFLPTVWKKEIFTADHLKFEDDGMEWKFFVVGNFLTSLKFFN